MGLTKTILFGDDPAHDGIRGGWQEAAAEQIAAHPHPIKTRRRNQMGTGPYWDPIWPSAVAAALSELGIKSIVVNGRYCVRTRQQADDVQRRAEIIYTAKSTNRRI